MEKNVTMTPLYEKHKTLGAQMAPFMGCMMPQHFGDPAAEHLAVRTAVGLFDAAHRCEALVSGKDALANLQNLLCTNLRSLEVGAVKRSLMLNMQGGVMDDVQVYRLDENAYRLAMHTMNRDKDLRHMQRQRFGEVTIEPVEGESRLSLDGPKAAQLLSTWVTNLPEAGRFAWNTLAGMPCRISRIGFAGEDGFSLCFALEDSGRMLDAIMDAGKAFGLKLCGSRSFDTLRVEAGHSRYGMDIDDAVNPLETGFRPLVHLEKRDFIGRDALVAGGEPRRARVGLKLERGEALSGAPVIRRDKEVGAVTSSAYCPYLNASLALALVETPYSDVGRKYRVEAGGEMVEAEVVPLPFYTR